MSDGISKIPSILEVKSVMNKDFARAHAALLALGMARAIERMEGTQDAAQGLNRAYKDVLAIADALYDKTRPDGTKIEEIRQVLEKFAELAIERDQPLGLGDYACNAKGAPLAWWHPEVDQHSVFSLLCKAENELELDVDLPRERSLPGGEKFAAHMRNKGAAFLAYQLLQRHVLADEWRWRIRTPHTWIAERAKGFAKDAPIPMLLERLSQRGEL